MVRARIEGIAARAQRGRSKHGWRDEESGILVRARQRCGMHDAGAPRLRGVQGGEAPAARGVEPVIDSEESREASEAGARWRYEGLQTETPAAGLVRWSGTCWRGWRRVPSRGWRRAPAVPRGPVRQ